MFTSVACQRNLARKSEGTTPQETETKEICAVESEAAQYATGWFYYVHFVFDLKHSIECPTFAFRTMSILSMPGVLVNRITLDLPHLSFSDISPNGKMNSGWPLCTALFPPQSLLTCAGRRNLSFQTATATYLGRLYKSWEISWEISVYITSYLANTLAIY